MLKAVDTSNFQVDFYSHHPDGNLKLIYSTEAIINLPEHKLDKMMTNKIDMDLGTFDWLQGLGR